MNYCVPVKANSLLRGRVVESLLFTLNGSRPILQREGETVVTIRLLSQSQHFLPFDYQRFVFSYYTINFCYLVRKSIE